MKRQYGQELHLGLNSSIGGSLKQDENVRWRWICEKVYLDDDNKSISEDDIRKGMYK